jgi:hypothetical protein
MVSFVRRGLMEMTKVSSVPGSCIRQLSIAQMLQWPVATMVSDLLLSLKPPHVVFHWVIHHDFSQGSDQICSPREQISLSSGMSVKNFLCYLVTHDCILFNKVWISVLYMCLLTFFRLSYLSSKGYTYFFLYYVELSLSLTINLLSFQNIVSINLYCIFLHQVSVLFCTQLATDKWT